MTNLLATVLLSTTQTMGYAFHTNHAPIDVEDSISQWIVASKEINSRTSIHVNATYFKKIAIDNLSEATTLLLKEVIELRRRVAKLENKEQ